MSSILKPIQRWFAPIEPIDPGIYHYISPQDDPRNYRLHLRIENDGAGVLIINASTVLHLNETAAEYAYYLVNNMMADEVAEKMNRNTKAWKELVKEAGDIMSKIKEQVSDVDSFLVIRKEKRAMDAIKRKIKRLEAEEDARFSDGSPRSRLDPFHHRLWRRRPQFSGGRVGHLVGWRDGRSRPDPAEIRGARSVGNLDLRITSESTILK